MSDNFFDDNPDLRFHLRRLDWDALVKHTELDPKDPDAFKNGKDALESYEAMLQSMGEYAAKEVAPYWKELDQQHPVQTEDGFDDPPRMKQCIAGLAQLGAMGLSLPRRLGGLNAPMLVDFAFMEVLGRADTAVMSHCGFHGGIAAALQLYSLEEGSFTAVDGVPVKTRFDAQIQAMASGKEWGAMVLTEPQAGSDLGQIRTAAKLQPDGTWRITGQKIYITSGHGEHHIVIARSEDPKEAAGLRGLSLFYVPAHRTENGQRIRNFTVGGVEHKMGQHSAVAATINYEDSHAELIGQRRQGFRGMLLLMNNARIAVGFQALGIAEAAYRKARDYAETRVTMGRAIANHEMVAEILDDMELNIRGLRAVCFDAAFHQEMAERMHVILRLRPPTDSAEREKMEKDARRHQRKARHLTPLIKYFAGEESVRISRMGMQVFGGLGYIAETGAEKLLRDALVLPIYEGTSQIQSLMALKDNLQAALRNPGKFFQKMANARVQALSERDHVEKGLARLQGYSYSAMQTIIARIAARKVGGMRDVPLMQWKHQLTGSWDPQKDFSFGMLHAERLTQLLCYAAIGEALWAQAQAARGTPDEAERHDLADRWMARWEPKARGILGEIETSAGSVLRALRRRPNGEHTNGNGKSAAAG
jgi:alkylation response protein AidB-like acyl-CoA dehydrogenase